MTLLDNQLNVKHTLKLAQKLLENQAGKYSILFRNILDKKVNTQQLARKLFDDDLETIG